MSLKEKIIAKSAKAFDKIRGKLGIEDDLEFLKLDDSLNDFDLVETVDSGWFIEYSEYRQQFKVQVATLDDDFRAAANSASNVRIGEEVYWIEKGDTLPPQGASVFWTFFCGRGLRKTNTGNRF